MLIILLLVGVLAAGAGCASSPGSQPPSNTSGVSFARDIQSIFNANCVVCHQGKGPAGLSLQSDMAYNNLVNVPSSESPLMRIAPGDPDKSYLPNKLQGTQGQVGGSGERMPFGAAPLPQTQIDLIRQWISQGAPNN